MGLRTLNKGAEKKKGLVSVVQVSFSLQSALK